MGALKPRLQRSLTVTVKPAHTRLPRGGAFRSRKQPCNGHTKNIHVLPQTRQLRVERCISACDPLTRSNTTTMIADRYCLAALVTFVLFANHWSRDSLGALELPIESNATGFGLSPRQYNSLNAVYFMPNIVMPLVAAAFSQHHGVALMYVRLLRLVFLGSVFIAFGAIVAKSVCDNLEAENRRCSDVHTDVPFALTLAGRIISGVAYEAVDVVGPIGLLAPHFRDRWSTLGTLAFGLEELT